MTDHEPSGRVVAFEAIVRLAIEEAADEDDRGYYYGRSGFDRSDVKEEIEHDVSLRTIDRALKDAAALGWLEDMVQGWDAGLRAEEVAPDPDSGKVTVCDDCDAVWKGLRSHCSECASESIRQVEPADPNPV